MEKQIRVFIGQAAGANPTWETVLSMKVAVARARATGINVVEMLTRGGGSAASARAVTAYEFLKSGCDYWIHNGCDVAVPPFFIEKLVRDDKDIVGAVYPKRSSTELIPATVFINHEKTWIEQVKNRALVPAIFTSGDGFCFKREVIRTLWDKHTELEYLYPGVDEPLRAIFMPTLAQTDKGMIYLEEDWAICHRARLAGFEIWLDCAVELQHYTGFFKGFGELYAKQSERVDSEGQGLCKPGHDNGGQLHPSPA